MGKSQRKKKGERKENVGRRRHLEEGEFFKQLEKMYCLSRVEGNGNVTVTFSKIDDKYGIKHAVQEGKAGKAKPSSPTKKSSPTKIIPAKDASEAADAVSAAKTAKAIVRGKRKGTTVSTLISASDVLRFQANLADCLRSNIETLKKVRKPKNKLKAKDVKSKRKSTTE